MRFDLIVAVLLTVVAPQQERLADRIVAVVNDEPILLSEIFQVVPAGMSANQELPALMLDQLEGMINQRLILQEVKRMKLFTVERGEVDEMRQGLLQRAGSPEAFNADLRGRGMSPVELDAYLQRIILIFKFIDYRFRRSIDIEDEELREYYRSEFLPRLQQEQPQMAAPPFTTVREEIRNLLQERRVNEALENWLTDARERARIVIAL